MIGPDAEDTRAEAAVHPSDGDITPDDVPDSVVIQTALYKHLGGDWDALDDLADACVERLGEYGRVIVRAPASCCPDGDAAP